MWQSGLGIMVSNLTSVDSERNAVTRVEQFPDTFEFRLLQPGLLHEDMPLGFDSVDDSLVHKSEDVAPVLAKFFNRDGVLTTTCQVESAPVPPGTARLSDHQAVGVLLLQVVVQDLSW